MQLFVKNGDLTPNFEYLRNYFKRKLNCFNSAIVCIGLSDLKIKLPATNTSAPASSNFLAFAVKLLHHQFLYEYLASPFLSHLSKFSYFL